MVATALKAVATITVAKFNWAFTDAAAARIDLSHSPVGTSVPDI